MNITHDLDVLTHGAIKNEIISNREMPEAGPEIIARGSEVWMLCEQGALLL